MQAAEAARILNVSHLRIIRVKKATNETQIAIIAEQDRGSGLPPLRDVWLLSGSASLIEIMRNFLHQFAPSQLTQLLCKLHHIDVKLERILEEKNS